MCLQKRQVRRRERRETQSLCQFVKYLVEGGGVSESFLLEIAKLGLIKEIVGQRCC